MKRPVTAHEEVTKVVQNADGTIDIHAKFESHRFVYEGVRLDDQQEISVGDVLGEAPQARARRLVTGWSPWDGEDVDA